MHTIGAAKKEATKKHLNEMPYKPIAKNIKQKIIAIIKTTSKAFVNSSAILFSGLKFSKKSVIFIPFALFLYLACTHHKHAVVNMSI